MESCSVSCFLDGKSAAIYASVAAKRKTGSHSTQGEAKESCARINRRGRYKAKPSWEKWEVRNAKWELRNGSWRSYRERAKEREGGESEKRSSPARISSLEVSSLAILVKFMAIWPGRYLRLKILWGYWWGRGGCLPKELYIQDWFSFLTKIN